MNTTVKNVGENLGENLDEKNITKKNMNKCGKIIIRKNVKTCFRPKIKLNPDVGGRWKTLVKNVSRKIHQGFHRAVLGVFTEAFEGVQTDGRSRKSTGASTQQQEKKQSRELKNPPGIHC